MFYINDLIKEKSIYSIIWIAANQGIIKKIKKKQIVDYNIMDACNMICKPDRPFSLRLSSTLLFGVVRIFSAKIQFTLIELTNIIRYFKENDTLHSHTLTKNEKFDFQSKVDLILRNNNFTENFLNANSSPGDWISITLGKEQMNSLNFSGTSPDLLKTKGDNTDGLESPLKLKDTYTPKINPHIRKTPNINQLNSSINSPLIAPVASITLPQYDHLLKSPNISMYTLNDFDQSDDNFGEKLFDYNSIDESPFDNHHLNFMNNKPTLIHEDNNPKKTSEEIKVLDDKTIILDSINDNDEGKKVGCKKTKNFDRITQYSYTTIKRWINHPEDIHSKRKIINQNELENNIFHSNMMFIHDEINKYFSIEKLGLLHKMNISMDKFENYEDPNLMIDKDMQKEIFMSPREIIRANQNSHSTVISSVDFDRTNTITGGTSKFPHSFSTLSGQNTNVLSSSLKINLMANENIGNYLEPIEDLDIDVDGFNFSPALSTSYSPIDEIKKKLNRFHHLIMNHFMEYSKAEKDVSLSELFKRIKSKREKCKVFVASLELHKWDIILLEQKIIFNEITLQRGAYF